MTAIALRDIEYTWPGQEAAVLKLDGLEIAKGESVFIRGPSGSGKSTLMGILSGITRPSRGRVHLLQTDIAAISPRRRDRFRAQHIGMVFQQFNLIPFLTVSANLRLASRFANRRWQESQPRALEFMGRLRLDPSLLQRRADTLSVGQQQRVAIARALINAPDILLADEPTSALDAGARDEFVSLLLSTRDLLGCTVVFASHDNSLADFFETPISLPDINLVKQLESDRV